MEAQRGLILISKLLQNLSNGIEFDESQEKYMSDLNKFLAEKMSVVQSFFNKLAVIFISNAQGCNQYIYIGSTQSNRSKLISICRTRTYCISGDRSSVT